MAFAPYVNMGQRVQFRYDPLASALVFASPCVQFPQLNMTQPWQDVSSQIRGTFQTIIPPYTTQISGSGTLGPAAIEPLQVGYRGSTVLNNFGAMVVQNNSNLHLGANLFTIETYVRWNTGNGLRMIYSDYAAGNVVQSAFYMPVNANQYLWYIDFGASGETLLMTVNLTITNGQWYHLVYQRSAVGRWQLFVDGVLRGTSAVTSNPNVPTTSNVCIGNYLSGTASTPTGNGSQANFQDYKIYKGVAKYSSAFTTVGTTYFTPPSSMIIAP